MSTAETPGVLGRPLKAGDDNGEITGRRTHTGHVAGAFFTDRMVITFETPCPAIAPDDTLDVRSARDEPMEMFPAAVRRDGGVSVWYAPHPLLRHWLGWLERIDDTHWVFRMEAMHIEILNGIPELCGD